jgi:hypothetical protein
VAVMMNLSVYDVDHANTSYSQLYTVPPCLSGGEGCVICPTILRETADRGGSTDDAVFPLVSMEGETTPSKVTSYECNCVLSLKVPLIFTLLARIIYAYVFCIVITVKYRNYYPKGTLFFGLQTRVLP